ncbi:MAG TPA: hypothetical protein VFP34_02790 [Microlunatus sp.]|nr:hypothetical protein [Microlunatus sp.]
MGPAHAQSDELSGGLLRAPTTNARPTDARATDARATDAVANGGRTGLHALPSAATLPALQRAAGNRAVAQLIDAGSTSVQRQPRRPSQAANIARLTTLRTNADRRVTLATDYQKMCLQVGDTTRDKLSAISAIYTQAYNTFRGVLNAAQQEAQNQQRWTDIIVGVICGTAAGLAAAFVLPSTAAGWFSLTLAEAGTAAASSAGQGLASAALSAAASSALTVPGQVISSAGLEPSIQQIAMWQKVAGIYRSGLEVAQLTQASHQTTMALSDLIADVRVFEAGGTTKLTDASIASTLTQLEQQDSQLTVATTELTNKITELQTMNTAVAAINPQAKTAPQMEKDIWVLWMATLAKNSNILDIDAIEDHIGPKGLKIVDFGWYTSDADENEAIDQARSDAMFLEAEANNAQVPAGQIIGGPHRP